MTITLDTLTGQWHNENGDVVESFRKTPVPQELYDAGWRSE